MASSRADLARRLSARRAGPEARNASASTTTTTTTTSRREKVAPSPTDINIARRNVAVAAADYSFDSDWDPISDGAINDSVLEDFYTGKSSPAHFSPSRPAMKRSSAAKQPSLADALRGNGREDSMTQSTTTQLSATFHARNTRFSRQTSSHQPALSPSATPVRRPKTEAGIMNPPTQSASLTLPNMPNVTELVAGARKSGTPLINKDVKARSSRFTSGSHNAKPSQPQHGPVRDVAISEEDKAIYASLHLLKDRVDQLEREKSEAQKRTEEYEIEITELRSQLSIIHHRPDSALGSDADFDGMEKLQGEKVALEASVATLQDRLSRSERKVSVSDISVKRITKERDDLAGQVGKAHVTMEELRAENSELKDNNVYLQYEYEELKEELEALRQENAELRQQFTHVTAAHTADPQRQQRRQDILNKLGKMVRDEKQKSTAIPYNGASAKDRMIPNKVSRSSAYSQGLNDRSKSDVSHLNSVTSEKSKSGMSHVNSLASAKDRSQIVPEKPIRSRKEASDIPPRRAHRPRSVDESMTRRLASTIAKEGQQSRDWTAITARTRSRSDPRQDSNLLQNQASIPSLTVSAPTDSQESDAESTTQLHFPQSSANLFKHGALPTADLFNPAAIQTTARAGAASIPEDDTRDTTMLSYQDPREISALREQLEDELRDGRLRGLRVHSSEHNPAFHEFRMELLSGKLRKDTEQKFHDELGKPKFHKSSAKDLSNDDDDTGHSSVINDKTAGLARVSKSVRVQSPHLSDESVNTSRQLEPSATSMLSNTSRRRRRVENADGMTSAFIVPDITLNSGNGLSSVSHDDGNCTSCPSTGKDVNIPAPVPVTEREDIDATDATIRPSQSPPVALATVIKQLEDEIAHLKIKLTGHQRLYNHHDASVSRRRRQDLKLVMDKLIREIEKRSDQVYALYDVLEGQKQATASAKKKGRRMSAPHVMEQQDVETTLSSLGMDTGEISGLIARASVAPPASLDGTESIDGPSGDDTEEVNTEDMH